MSEFINRQIIAVKDALGPSRIKELTSLYVDGIENAKIVAFRDLKPWGMFFTHMNPSAVQWDWVNVEQRICTNLLYYRSNYFIIFCLALVLGLILNPIIIFSECKAAIVAISMKGPIMVGEYEVDGNMRLAICSICAIAFFAISGALQALLFCTLFGTILCLTHMLLRSRNTSVSVTPAHTDIRLAIFTALGVSNNGFVVNLATNASNFQSSTNVVENDLESGVDGEDVPLIRRKSNTNTGHIQ